MNEAAEVVTSAADANANVIFGAVIDDAKGDEITVTVIATGFGGRPRRRRVEAPGTPVAATSERRFERPVASDADIEIPSFLRED